MHHHPIRAVLLARPSVAPINPTLDLGRLVRAVVVDDEMQGQVRRGFPIQLLRACLKNVVGQASRLPLGRLAPLSSRARRPLITGRRPAPLFSKHALRLEVIILAWLFIEWLLQRKAPCLPSLSHFLATVFSAGTLNFREIFSSFLLLDSQLHKNRWDRSVPASAI